MGLNVTKGGLARAKLINLGTKEEVPCMFNPFEYTLTKSNSWGVEPAKGQNVPKPNFTQGGKQVLKLTLIFDALAEKQGDVRKYTDALWKMMMVDENKKNRESGKSQPPEVAFEWGRLYFKAVLTNMSQKFTLFKPDGTPVRCSVDVTLEQLIDIDDYKDSDLPEIAALDKAISKIQEAAKSVEAVEGDRIDNIAAKVGETVRKVLEDNNIDNPLNIPVGKLLKF
jgi:hypothetical protein